MGISPDLTLTRATTTKIKMSVSVSTPVISCFLFSSQFLSTFASVAVGYAKLNPDNPNECVDPDTGVGHRLGTSWSVSGCGEARCALRHGTVYISYSYDVRGNSYSSGRGNLPFNLQWFQG